MANVIKVPNRINSSDNPTQIIAMTSSGRYSPPRDCMVRVHMLGGGGGGANGGPNATRGSGAGYVMKTLRVKAGVSYNVTVGSGGSGGAQASSQPYDSLIDRDGSDGGNTSFTNWDIEPIIAYGGQGSRRTPTSPFIGCALGGFGAGGDIIYQGGTTSNTAAGQFSGFGGKPVQGSTSPFGLTSAFPFTNYKLSASASNYGLGGAAGTSQIYPWQPSVTYYLGGTQGSPGVVIIEEF